MAIATTPSAEFRWSADVQLGPGWGWTHHRLKSGAKVSLKGYVFDGGRTLEGHSAAVFVFDTIGTLERSDLLPARLQRLAGHFALVIETPEALLATVDRIRSIPLFYASTSNRIKIDDRAIRLRDACGFGPGDLDIVQAKAAALSGYTIGDASIYRQLKALRPGEAILAGRDGHKILRWYIYEAWKTDNRDRASEDLSDLNRRVLERLRVSAADRPICVPLSAGYDSRLIAAGLKHVGAKNVRLFSYGRPGNHDADTAKKIADKLGFPWKFVPFSIGSQRALYDDTEHDRLIWTEADSCTAAPFQQDWSAVAALRKSGYITDDALVVNGQTGDFISGNHIPPQLLESSEAASELSRRSRLLSLYLSKHYRLWEGFVSANVQDRICELLQTEIDLAGASDGRALHGIYEMLEYQDRQAKYVVGGQRTYEALGLAWRLPLWDDDYVAFWRTLPGQLKVGQSLYRAVLERDNWGGVFSGIPVNRKVIRPSWIIPIRFAAKLAHWPLGVERWHRFERRVFNWWMDPLCISAIVPYRRALRDTRGARHGLSWVTERWLSRHGVNLESLFKE